MSGRSSYRLVECARMRRRTAVDQHASTDPRQSQREDAREIGDLVVENRRNRQLRLIGEEVLDVRIADKASTFETMHAGDAALHRLLRGEIETLRSDLRIHQRQQLRLHVVRELLAQRPQQLAGLRIAIDPGARQVEVEELERAGVEGARMAVPVQEIDDVAGRDLVELPARRIASLRNRRVRPSAPHDEAAFRDVPRGASHDLLNLPDRRGAGQIGHLLHETRAPEVHVRVDEAGEGRPPIEIDGPAAVCQAQRVSGAAEEHDPAAADDHRLDLPRRGLERMDVAVVEDEIFAAHELRGAWHVPGPQ